MIGSRRWLAAAAVSCGVAALPLLTAGGCASPPDPNAVTEVLGPDYDQFKGTNVTAPQSGVSRVLERRCGTLDCHGQIARPLRLYSQQGLRLQDEGGATPGTTGTTEAEYLANYQAIVSVQPETMTLVVQGVDPPESLMLVRKPLGLERHKAQKVFELNDTTYNCITSWLKGQADFTACGQAAVP
jgi:hypothetical protein